MRKFAAVFVMAGALLVPRAGATQGPDLDLTAKAKSQTPAAPVTAPLSIGTAFNATLVDVIDTRRAKPVDPVTAEVVENGTSERRGIFPKGTKGVRQILPATSGGRGAPGPALFVRFDKAI